MIVLIDSDTLAGSRELVLALIPFADPVAQASSLLTPELLKIALTASFTLIGGCVLYLFSQSITKIVVEPYVEYRKVLGEITFKLVVDKARIVSGRAADEPDEHRRISQEIRELSARLRASITAVPFISILRKLGLVEPHKNIEEAAGFLIRISNLMLESNKNYDLIYKDFQQIGVVLSIDVGGN